MAASAASRGWGAGWPKDRSKDTVAVKAGGIKVRVHKQIAELVGLLLDETVRRGYALDGTADDWGYAGRYIAGTSTPSNHSWGLALDLNATSNPQSSKLITDMPSWMPALWGRYGFRWGGNYVRSKKDAMHYEYMDTPAMAAFHTDLARRELAQPDPAPTPEPEPEEEDAEMHLITDGTRYAKIDSFFFITLTGPQLDLVKFLTPQDKWVKVDAAGYDLFLSGAVDLTHSLGPGGTSPTDASTAAAVVAEMARRLSS